MPTNPNKLSQFWQELKRRKVVRVITVYAAVAFIILQLIEILAPSLRLPEWTMNFILVLLIVGFIIAIILSWIYDVNPEGGIVKTEPAHHEKSEDKPTSSKGWKIASYFSFVVIVALIVFNIVSTSNRSKDISNLEKSIAVRPFWNESTDKENESFVNGMTEDIRNSLAKIADLRVISRGSVEKYREAEYTTLDIAQDLDVTYVLEGTSQRIEDQVKIHVQLILAENDDHIWQESYREEIKDAKQIYDLQSHIAQSIANEIKVIITPEEKQLIEKVPTTNQTAYEFYQKGQEANRKYKIHLRNTEALEEAELLNNLALEYDSTFAAAYNELASVFWYRSWIDTSSSEVFLDSALILADIALTYDHQYAGAYLNRSRIFRLRGDYDQALIELDKANKLNPNDHQVYKQRGYVYYRSGNLFETISNLEKAISLDPANSGKVNFIHLSEAYRWTGFDEKAKHYIEEELKWYNDTSRYNIYVSYHNYIYGDYQSVIELSHEVLAKDPLNRGQLELITMAYIMEHQYDSALVYYTKLESLDQGSLFPRWFGYTLIQNGEVAEGEKYIEEDFVKFRNQQEQKIVTPSNCLALGEIYAYRGENEKAFEQLRTLVQQDGNNFDLSLLRTPLWDNIRNETEFQQIVSELEAKFQAEHKRVRQWLEENDRCS